MLNRPDEPPAAAADFIGRNQPVASFVIPTRNRKDILLRCVESAFAQDVPVEVLVFDDGSSDGTAEALAAAFPAERYPMLRYERHAGGNGPCKLRNRGTLLARSEFVFPLDDDSVLSSPDIVRHVLGDFQDPRVAVVSIPYINVNHGPAEHLRPPDPATPTVLAEYLGASHAVRRSAFLGVGGYREMVFQYGEEGDVGIRLLNQGLIILMSNAKPIHHYESPSRNVTRWQRLGPQNNVFIAFCNVPLAALPVHLAATTYNNIRHGLRKKSLPNVVVGLLSGYAMSVRYVGERKPVSMSTYRLFRELRRRTAAPLREVEGRLSPAMAVPIVERPATPPSLVHPAAQLSARPG